MLFAWAEVERLVETGAVHRKGFRLSEVKPQFILEHAQDELIELMNSPDDIDELADLFGCLIHYAVKKDWSEADLEAAILKKLEMRFSTGDQ